VVYAARDGGGIWIWRAVLKLDEEII